jgi:hypothetical protein
VTVQSTTISEWLNGIIFERLDLKFGTSKVPLRIRGFNTDNCAHRLMIPDTGTLHTANCAITPMVPNDYYYKVSVFPIKLIMYYKVSVFPPREDPTDC